MGLLATIVIFGVLYLCFIISVSLEFKEPHSRGWIFFLVIGLIFKPFFIWFVVSVYFSSNHYIQSRNEMNTGFLYFIEEHFDGALPSEHFEMTFDREVGRVRTTFSDEFVLELFAWFENNGYYTRPFGSFLNRLERGEKGVKLWGYLQQ